MHFRYLYLRSRRSLRHAAQIGLISLACGGCKTYYQKTSKFQRLFEGRRFDAADQLLAQDTKAPAGRNQLLYYLNRGVLHHLMGHYARSNEFFHQAFLFAEDTTSHLGEAALTLLVNSSLNNYLGEPHEILLIHYYKALNFIQLRDLPAALVECRQLDVKLQALADKYEGKDSYRQDAFIHLLMGLVYQANAEYNQAFIAYRNALKAYEGGYARLFGVKCPAQLQQDLLYCAYKTGFMDEVQRYERKWGIRYHPPTAAEEAQGSLVCLWHNGLGPVKAEWGLNFVITPTAGGVIFVNEEFNLAFPFPTGSNVKSLSVLRVAFPKYENRLPMYCSAQLNVNHQSQKLALVEPVEAIARKTLAQRMHWELGKGLLRLALKQLAAKTVERVNTFAGIGLNVLNAVTEKADTRNWQTLPHSIYYARVPLPAGVHQVQIQLQAANLPVVQTLQDQVTIPPHAGTSFYMLHTPEIQSKSKEKQAKTN